MDKRIATQPGQNRRERKTEKMGTSPFPDLWKVLLSGISTVLVCLFLIRYADKPAAFAVGHLPHECISFFSRVTVLGNSAPYLIFFGILPLFLFPASRMDWWRQWHGRLRQAVWISLFLFLAIALSGLLVVFLKIIFGRYRPVMLFESGKYGFTFFQLTQARKLSFPSGHTDTIFAFMTALSLLIPRHRIPFFCLAIVVAASRVLIGAHYPSDVVMGGYLGIVTTLYLKGIFLSKGLDIFSKNTN